MALPQAPFPGDLVVCRRELKSMQPFNALIKVGTMGIVIHTNVVGKRFWMLVLIEERWVMFSHKAHVVHLNWERWSPSSQA